jgi:ABC-type bacteriocin/lantibiotic exporter with double-glycine peptidase domain
MVLALAALIAGPPMGEAVRPPDARAAAAPPPGGPPVRLEVPVIAQARERCGPAALAMVLRFYGAPDSAVAGTERAYSPALRGALITDLARCAERAGYAARVASLDEDSLLVLLRSGVPPILHYRRGPGPLTRGHFAVLVGWEPARDEFLANDGGARTARLGRAELLRRWRAAGSLALVVERRPP